MTTRWSANHIAEYVSLLGMTGTYKYCKYAEDALHLKSLNLIISTLDVFAVAFSYRFDVIYPKYKVDFPLSPERFLHFLEPRCLLLTKDDKCFNFMLVCAFVSDIIFSFVHYNKCFHLVETASRCLAATLKNRFKRIFEDDSGWEELMSFCKKIHTLIYPPEEKSESDGNQSVGDVGKLNESEEFEKETKCSFPFTDKVEASFTNFTQGLAESTVEKYSADDVDYFNMKMSGKNSSTQAKIDLTIEKAKENLEGLCYLELPPSIGAANTNQVKIEDSTLKLKNTAREDNEEDCATDAELPDLEIDFNHVAVKTAAISSNKEDTENLEQKSDLKKNLIRPFEDFLGMKKLTERLEELGTLELSATGPTQTLQRTDEDSLPKKTVDIQKTYDGNNAREDNEVCDTDMKGSLSPNLAPSIVKFGINKNDQCTEKLGQMSGFKKNVTFIWEGFNCKESVRKVQFVKHIEPTSSADASQTIQLKGEDSSSNEQSEDKGKVAAEKYAGEEEVCGATRMSTSTPYSALKVSKNVHNKNEEGTKKLGPMIGFKKHLTLSFVNDSPVKKGPEKFKGEHTSSTDASSTLKMKAEDTSAREEWVGNKNDYLTHSLPFDSAPELHKMLNEPNVINNVAGAEKPSHTMSYKKKLTLGEDLIAKGAREKPADLFNLVPSSSTGAPHTLQFRGTESSNEESEYEHELFNVFCMKADEVRSRITDNPQHLTEIMSLLKKCEEDIEPNLFSPDEYKLLSDRDDGEDLEACGSISESSSSDANEFELLVKSIAYMENLKKYEPVLRENNPSEDEMSDELVSGCSNPVVASQDRLCPLCTKGMCTIFKTWINTLVEK